MSKKKPTKQKHIPFWEQNINPITMQPPVRYYREDNNNNKSYHGTLPTFRRTKEITFLSTITRCIGGNIYD